MNKRAAEIADEYKASGEEGIAREEWPNELFWAGWLAAADGIARAIRSTPTAETAGAEEKRLIGGEETE